VIALLEFQPDQNAFMVLLPPKSQLVASAP